MSARTWYLVRHGETEWNATARMQGQLDSVLTPRGVDQVRATATLLVQLGIDRLYASPLGRVRATVALMNEQLALPVRFDDRLKEWSAGDWSGERYVDIRLKWPVEWGAWEADRVTYASPGGENFLDLADRAQAFLADVAQERVGPRRAIVAHGFINRAIAGVLLSQAPADTLGIRQDNDTIIRIVQDGNQAVADHFAGSLEPIPGLPTAARWPHGAA
jgi:broad specificity phosphatase PhoE